MKLLSRFLVGDCGDVQIVKFGLMPILRLTLQSVQLLTRLLLHRGQCQLMICRRLPLQHATHQAIFN